MKNMKKILALLVAALMIVASVSAFAVDADNTPTISINASDDFHVFKVFQILTGTLAAEGETALGNPAFGADFKDSAKTTYATPDAFISALAGKTNQNQIESIIDDVIDTSTAGRGTISNDGAEGRNASLEVVPGYYVLVDVTPNDVLQAHNATKSLSVVQVINNVTINPKAGTTTDDKVIESDTLGTDNADKNNNPVYAEDDPATASVDESNDGKADNVSVGDTVNFKLTAKVPENADKFNNFFFIINDTLSEGLTFTPNSIAVSVDDGNGGETPLSATTDYTVRYKDGNPATTGDPQHTFEVGMITAKNYPGKNIYVRYSATLNQNAVIGEEGNPNTSTVKYSNNPDDEYDGNTTGFPSDDTHGAFGETPITETKTYTTGIEIQKVDEKGNVLTGATFEISGTSIQTVLKRTETFRKDNTKGVYYKLKDGKYTKQAPDTANEYMQPQGVNASDTNKTGYVQDDTATSSDPGYIEIEGKKYRTVKIPGDEGKALYTKVTGNGYLYEGTDKYVKEWTTEAVESATEHKASMAVNENGLARFDGLGAGEYTIKETVTPKGYNTLSDLTVNITFDKDGTPKWSKTGTGDGWTYDPDEGIFKITIENNKGTELPSTGGMGTTLLYIGGSILVVLAAVLLITKRRMSAND